MSGGIQQSQSWWYLTLFTCIEKLTKNVHHTLKLTENRHVYVE